MMTKQQLSACRAAIRCCRRCLAAPNHSPDYYARQQISLERQLAKLKAVGEPETARSKRRPKAERLDGVIADLRSGTRLVGALRASSVTIKRTHSHRTSSGAEIGFGSSFYNPAELLAVAIRRSLRPDESASGRFVRKRKLPPPPKLTPFVVNDRFTTNRFCGLSLADVAATSSGQSYLGWVLRTTEGAEQLLDARSRRKILLLLAAKKLERGK